MSLYNVSSGTTPQATDVNQITDIFRGQHDLWNSLILAPPLLAPANTTALATATGTGLSVGQYYYAVTYVTGYINSKGQLYASGETAVSPMVAITTTTGNQQVTINSIPTSSANPNPVVARRIYRTQVGQSNSTVNLRLVATILNNSQTNYTDSAPDSSIVGNTNAPTSNQTGTSMFFGNGSSIGMTPDLNVFQVYTSNSGIVSALGGQAGARLLANTYWTNAGYTTQSNGAASVFKFNPDGSIIINNANSSAVAGSVVPSTNPDHAYTTLNHLSRSHVEAYQGAQISMAGGGAAATVRLNTVRYDNLTEYSASNWKFTAQKSGTYTIHVSARIINMTTAGYVQVYVILGGSRANSYLVYQRTPAANEPCDMGGSISLYLAAGDYITASITTQTACTIDSGENMTYMHITRN